MKVVLFCGGRGLRLREHSEAVPKPMVQIGYRPILWHVERPASRMNSAPVTRAGPGRGVGAQAGEAVRAR